MKHKSQLDYILCFEVLLRYGIKHLQKCHSYVLLANNYKILYLEFELNLRNDILRFLLELQRNLKMKNSTFLSG
eukprot:snap_masked-scaffold_68-processed-gene-0.58-mRNA-1 protein AED:1.00 eAED:1.00 QI:0/0/0/0/1/1/4/0/73